VSLRAAMRRAYVCLQSSQLLPAPPSSSSSPSTSSAPALALVLSLSLTASPALSPYFSLSTAEAAGHSYSREELRGELKKRVQDIKRQHAGAWMNGEVSFRLRFEGKGKDEVHIIELRSVQPTSIWEVVSNWIRILDGNVELHSISDDPSGVGKIVSFVSSCGRSSFTISGRGGSVLSLYKDGGFSDEDLNHVVRGYEHALLNPTRVTQGLPGNIPQSSRQYGRDARTNPDTTTEATEDPVGKLEGLGVSVHRSGETDLSWESLAGYSAVKREIKNTILTPLLHPDVYDNITKYTRESFESNRPKAVLLEGPPGTGKTLTARIIANESNRPMIHLPVETIASKWYGDSEKKLSQIFDACDALGGAVIFIDEIDALVGSRDNSQMHEATRRILSVILQRVEGFSGRGKSILICATNRKKDLDSALLSRFDVTVRYDLPDHETRMAVFKRYAKQLGRVALHDLAAGSEGFSSRDIKDVCEHAERTWASSIIAKGDKTAMSNGLPTSKDYIESLAIRKSLVNSTCD